jgi:tripartite-type tricarboxylate transporter receptor subunit TctC
MGQTFIVENVSGGGVIATQATARAAPDGYTLMQGYVGRTAPIRDPQGAVRRRQGFHRHRDDRGTPNVLVVHPRCPPTT